MTALRIEIDGGRSGFKPGETLEGTVSWELAAAPKGVEVRLFWHTKGKGTQDREVVKTVRWDHLARSDRKRFTIQLPDGPYSFSGKLVSLVWSLEAEDEEEDNKAGPVVLTLSPTGSELLLHRK